MSIPVKIINEITALQTQVLASAPLSAAPFSQLKAIQLNTQKLETDTTVALSNAAGLLDTWVAPNNTPGIIAGFLARQSEANDQWHLDDMLDVISRTLINVNIVIGQVNPPLR